MTGITASRWQNSSVSAPVTRRSHSKHSKDAYRTTVTTHFKSLLQHSPEKSADIGMGGGHQWTELEECICQAAAQSSASWLGAVGVSATDHDYFAIFEISALNLVLS